MQTLTKSLGKTTGDIEILLIVSYSGTQNGVFPTTDFEIIFIFILKFVKSATFVPKNEKLTFDHDK